MNDRLEQLKSALADRYEIERKIGQGGMATVYLARDVKHNRQVAVKVLRPDLAAALGHERFLREIEIAANLTHPHILPLYDSGEADGFLYYVMPYIQGDTLRDRIDKEGELPVAEAVRIIREVTDALAFAHAQGVVHRDIKPDNIMLSGRHAMVMDFGVAKAVSEATGRNTLTTAGVALGTPTYMSPEQATADPHIDHRADIYAIGVMGYELLAGRTPFHGASPQAVLAAHITEQADPVSKYRDQVAPELESVIMKCLAKRPADRWQSADEMVPLLETMTTSSGGLTPTTTRPIQGITPRPQGRVWWIALGAVATLVVLGVFGARMMREEPLRVTVANVRQVTHSPLLEIFPDISDDGHEIAYAAGQAFNYDVFIRDTEGGPALALTGERVGLQWWPRWSPGGREVRFFDFTGPLTQGSVPTVMEVPKFGGQARRLAVGFFFESEAVALHGVAPDSLEVRATSTGDLVAVLSPSAENVSYAIPSPNGSKAAYVLGNQQYYSAELLGNDVPTSIWVTGLDAWSPVRITPDEHLDIHPTWLGNDQILFVSNRDGQRDLYLVALKSSGAPAAKPVRVTTGADIHTVSVTPDGRLAAYSKLQFRSNLYELTLADHGEVSIAEARPLTRESALIEQHDRSADGQWLVYDSNILGQQDIFLRPLAGGEPRRLTVDPGQDMDPGLSPDGSEIVFYSTRHGSRDVYLIDVDGQNERRLTGVETDGWPADQQEIFPAFSPDGLSLAFMAGYQASAYRLVVVDRPSVQEPWGPPMEIADSASPFFTWTRGGHHLVYQTVFSELRRISKTGDSESVVGTGSTTNPVWPYIAPDGRLYYQATGPDQVRGIYVVDQGGGEPRRVVRFDDSRVVSSTFGITVRGRSLVLTVDEKESDIYVMELEY